MSYHAEQPELLPIAVHKQSAANAQLRLDSLLATAGVSAGETRHLVAAIQDGAVKPPSARPSS